jgi:hypothetical protein
VRDMFSCYSVHIFGVEHILIKSCDANFYSFEDIDMKLYIIGLAWNLDVLDRFFMLISPLPLRRKQNFTKSCGTKYFFSFDDNDLKLYIYVQHKWRYVWYIFHVDQLIYFAKGSRIVQNLVLQITSCVANYFYNFRNTCNDLKL